MIRARHIGNNKFKHDYFSLPSGSWFRCHLSANLTRDVWNRIKSIIISREAGLFAILHTYTYFNDSTFFLNKTSPNQISYKLNNQTRYNYETPIVT